MPNELIVIEKKNARELFVTPDSLKELLAGVDEKVLQVAPDLSTDKGRKEIASAAYRVAQTKTYIDKIGKEITDELKELPKIVDANRKFAREYLDNLKDKVRQPLTEWEAEQERIKAEEEARIAAEKLRQEIEEAHEIALLYNEKFDREREEKRKEEERLQKERDERIAREAEERARLAAEQAAKAERERLEHEALEAKLAQVRAEREKIEAEQRAKAQAEAAAKAAAEAERKRIEDEQRAKAEAEAKAKEEAEKQAKNRAHRMAVNNEILNALIALGLSEENGKAVITAAAKGQAGRLTINY